MQIDLPFGIFGGSSFLLYPETETSDNLIKSGLETESITIQMQKLKYLNARIFKMHLNETF